MNDRDGQWSLRTQRRLLWLILLLSCVLYGSALLSHYTFDDIHSISKHVGVTGPFSIWQIFMRNWWGDVVGPGVSSSWRPITTLTLWATYQLGGPIPWGAHLANVLLFAATLWLSERVLRRWLGDVMRPSVRLWCVLAFACLAVHNDVVPSLTGRAELLAMLFSLLAIDRVLGAAPPTPIGSFGAAASVLLACLSKESALPMLPMLPIFAWLCHRRAGTLRFAPLAWLSGLSALAAAVYVALRAFLVPMFTGALDAQWSDNLLVRVRFLRRLAGAAEVLTHYLQHAFVPIDLAPDYSYAAITVSPSGFGVRMVLGALLAVAAVLLFAVATARKAPIAEVLLGFATSYVIVSHVPMPASTIVADRLFYFPSFWLCVLVAMGVDALVQRAQLDGRRRKLLAIVLAAYLAMQAVFTMVLTFSWHNQLSLLTRALQATPHVARDHHNYAIELEKHRRYADAAWHFVLTRAIYAEFPAPIPADAFSPDWDDLPVLERFVRLRAQVGAHRYRNFLFSVGEQLRKEHPRETLLALQEVMVATLPADAFVAPAR